MFDWTREDCICRRECDAAAAAAADAAGGFNALGFFLRLDLSIRADDDNILNRSFMAMNGGLV